VIFLEETSREWRAESLDKTREDKARRQETNSEEGKREKVKI